MKPKKKKPRGFAALSPARLAEIQERARQSLAARGTRHALSEEERSRGGQLAQQTLRQRGPHPFRKYNLGRVQSSLDRALAGQRIRARYRAALAADALKKAAALAAQPQEEQAPCPTSVTPPAP